MKEDNSSSEHCNIPLIRQFRVSWIESHRVSTIVEAKSPEEALEIAQDEDSNEFLDIEEVDAYGPADPDSYEVELVDEA